MVSILSSLSSSQNIQQNLFSRIDANSDGKVSQDEFVSARPEDVSESQAANLYSQIDTEGTGAVTETQLSEGLATFKPSGDTSSLGSNLSSDVLSAILQAVQNVSEDDASSSEALFTAMDTDGDGNVTQEEFLNARPEGVSEEDALALFESIDTDDDGSFTLAQFEGSLPPGGPPPAGGGSQSQSSEETYDALDTNEDGIVSFAEYLAGNSNSTESTESDQSSSSQSTTTDWMAQLAKAIEAYASSSVNVNATMSLEALA